MLSNLMDTLQGPAVAAVDSGDAEASGAAEAVPLKQGESVADRPRGGGPPAPAAGSSFSLWGMATALAENVKKGAADIAETVAETDWRSELQSFQRGVEEDTKHTAAEARQASLDAVHTLGSLGALGSLDAVHTLGGLGALGRARAAPEGAGARGPPEGEAAAPGGADGLDAARVAQSLTQARSWLDLENRCVGSRLRGLGASLLSGTTGLLEKVHDSISAELEGMEGQLLGRTRPGAGPAATQAAGGGAGARYSRLEAEVSAMQRNSGTYCDEPEDAGDYAAWLSGFDLAARRGEIDAIAASNAFMAELQARIVPLIVQYDVFWTRYFYQLHRLQRTHEARQQLAQRARASAEEDAIGWDDDLAPHELAPAAAAEPGPAEHPAVAPPAPREGALQAGGDAAEEGAGESDGQEDAGGTSSGDPDLKSGSAGGRDGSAEGAGSAPANQAEGASSGGRGGGSRPPPPPVAVKAGAPMAAGSSTSSPVQRKEVSPETSTASDDSGAAPWTVVTSPSAASHAAAAAAAAAMAAAGASAASPAGADEAMSPLAAALDAREGSDIKVSATHASVRELNTEKEASSAKALAGEVGERSGAGPAPKQALAGTAKKGAAASTPTADAQAAATGAAVGLGVANSISNANPVKGPSVPPAIAEAGEDLEEISDDEGAAAAGGESDVDEDWGGDWE